MTAPRTVRAFPLRWHLLLLVVGTLVPLVVFAGVMLARLAGEERAGTERRLLLAATAMADEFDREIASSFRALEVLAQSEHLERGDLADFHAEARRAVDADPTWRALAVYDASGKPVLNTRYDWGRGSLPPTGDPRSLRLILEGHQPLIGTLYAADDGWAFPLRMAVMHDGELRYVVTAILEPAGLQRLVARVSTPEEWMRSVVDSDGVIAARRKEPERFVGQVTRIKFLAEIGRASEGVFRNISRDGLPVHVAFCRAASSGWTAVVTAPQDAVDAPVYRSIMNSTLFGAGIVTLTGIGAWLFARRLERSIASAADGAAALAHGERPITDPSRIAEVARLTDSLWQSSELLIRRQRERDEHLARAQSSASALAELNQSLEDRVRLRTAESEERAAQLRALATVMTHAEDRERRRISLLLYHHLQQVLIAAKGRLWAGRQPGAAEQPGHGEVDGLLEASLEISRTLTVELSPPVLHDEGLPHALVWLGQHMGQRHALTVHVETDPAAQPGDEVVALFLFHAARELLLNVAKHSGVPHASVHLWLELDGFVGLSVCDTGRGFDPELAGVGPAGGAGYGLFSIRERLTHLGGRMTIDSLPGRLTTIVIRIPRCVARNPAPLAPRA